MINIKHGHWLLIHGSSVFLGYILDSPLPRLVQYVPKTQTCHVSKGSDHVLSTYNPENNLQKYNKYTFQFRVVLSKLILHLNMLKTFFVQISFCQDSLLRAKTEVDLKGFTSK